MRVIAGSARRLKLKTLEGMNTRPTQDIIKETLFNILQVHVPGSRFLDLFAGSGSIGIEALSRGASKAVFLENDRRAMDIIRSNLEFTHLRDRAVLIQGDALSGLNQLERKGGFHLIYLDPPYGKGLEDKVLEYLSRSSLLEPEGIIILETSRKTEYPYLEELGYVVWKEMVYRHNRHLFLQKAAEEPDGFEKSSQ